jgi:pimeloyl-ACP methyl ester carboxylesterase
MLTDETVPAEGGRYAAPLVLVPGLWAGRDAWRGFSTYLAHRGWECRLLDLRGAGGLEARTTALVDYVAHLPTPPVVVGHGAGALVAAAAAAGGRVAAVVMVAPLASGQATTRMALLTVGTLFGVALARPVAPSGRTVATILAGLSDVERGAVAARFGPDDGAALRDLVRGRLPAGRLGVPALVVGGAVDPLLPPPAADALARAYGADLRTVDAAGHWLLAGARWQAAVDTVHRWIVQRLGEPLLETYAEAMADREAEED